MSTAQLEKAMIALQRILDEARRNRSDAYISLELDLSAGGVAHASTVVRTKIKK